MATEIQQETGPMQIPQVRLRRGKDGEIKREVINTFDDGYFDPGLTVSSESNAPSTPSEM